MTAWRAGLTAAVAIGLYGLFLGSIADTARVPAPDFPNYYYAARNLATGSSIYGDVSDQMLTDFGVVDPDVNYFADPPPVAVLFYPVQELPYEAAWWLLISLSVIGMISTVWITGSQLGFSRHWIVVLAALSLLTTSFRFLTVTNHFEVVLALLAALGWVRLRRRGSPGVYWGLAAALKIFPALWTVAQIRSRKVIAVGAVTFGVAVAATTWMVGYDDVVTFVREVVPRSRQWYEATGNYSLMSVGTLIGGTSFGWVFTALGVLGFFWTISRLGNQPDALYVSGVAWSLLLSPLAWLNYLVVAVSPILVAYPHLDWSRPRHRWPGFVMLAGLLALRPILSFDNYWLSVALSRIPTVSLLLLAIWAPLLMVRNTEMHT